MSQWTFFFSNTPRQRHRGADSAAKHAVFFVLTQSSLLAGSIRKAFAEDAKELSHETRRLLE